MTRARSNNDKTNSANIGFEAKLWLAVDKLRSNMDVAEYKHVVLGIPPRGNASVQHLTHRLVATGIAGFSLRIVM